MLQVVAVQKPVRSTEVVAAVAYVLHAAGAELVEPIEKEATLGLAEILRVVSAIASHLLAGLK